MAPPPALAYAERVDPAADAVRQMLDTMVATGGDRIVLETGAIPMLFSGPHKCALMVGRLPLNSVKRIATYLFPRECLDALEEIGGTRTYWPGFMAIALYDDIGLTIEIRRGAQ